MPTINEHSGVITVGNSGTADVPGAWVELIASAARDSVWSVIYVAPAAFPAGNQMYLDVAIGAMGSEVIILNKAAMHGNMIADFNDSLHFLGLPLRFQTGDRIIARIQDNNSFGVNYHVMLRNFE